LEVFFDHFLAYFNNDYLFIHEAQHLDHLLFSILLFLLESAEEHFFFNGLVSADLVSADLVCSLILPHSYSLPKIGHHDRIIDRQL